MSSLYLNPELEPAAAVVGALVGIRGDEARHAATVSRARLGERIAIGNGEGVIVWGLIVTVDPAETVIEVDEVRFDDRATPELWLVQALAKGDRDELAVQAATELGVAGGTVNGRRRASRGGRPSCGRRASSPSAPGPPVSSRCTAPRT